MRLDVRNEGDNNQLGYGGLGFDRLTTGQDQPEGNVYYYIVARENSVISFTNVLDGATNIDFTLNAGFEVWGELSSLTVVSGEVLAYKMETDAPSDPGDGGGGDPGGDLDPPPTLNWRDVDTSGQGHKGEIVATAHFHPMMYNGNGKAFFAMPDRFFNINYFQYTYSNQLLEGPFDWGKETGVTGDIHNLPTTTILPSGKILCLREQHNDKVVVKRSLNPYDVSSYESLGEITEVRPAYPNVNLVGNRVVMMCRDYTDSNQPYRNSIFYSDDEGATWSSRHIAVDLGAGGNQGWAYPRTFYNTEGRLIYVTSRRAASNDFREWYLWELDATDLVTVSNIEGTWSKNTLTEGPVTENEMKNHCQKGYYQHVGGVYLGSDTFVMASHIASTGSEIEMNVIENGVVSNKAISDPRFLRIISDRVDFVVRGTEVWGFAWAERASDSEKRIVYIRSNDLFDTYEIEEVSTDNYRGRNTTPYNGGANNISLFATTSQGTYADFAILEGL